MRTSALCLAASALALASPLVVSQAARAADVDAAAAAADQPQATAPSQQASTVTPLTITAERRTVNLQTAPIAATVLSGSKLQDEGILNLDDLQFHTPSLTVADFGQGNLFNIRGIGKDLTNVQTPSGVVTYWDGIAAFPGFFQDQPYYDISNVEVLRGPQGTFAGQNATGGAVFITTADPKIGNTSGDIEGQYGNYNDGLIRGFINMPLNDQLALRISVNGEYRDSFYTVAGPWTTAYHGTPGRQLIGSFRVGLAWEPNENWRWVFKADYSYLDHGGFLASPTLNAAGTALNPAPLFQTSSFIDDYATNKGLFLTLNGAYTNPEGYTFHSITGWESALGNANIDLLETGQPGDFFQDYGREQIFSQEFNVVSPSGKGPLSWVAGLYYQHDYVSLLQGGGAPGFDIHVIVPGVGFEDLDLNYRTPKTTQAVFGQVTYDITSALQLQLGGRWTHEAFSMLDDSPTIFDGVILLSDAVAAAKTSNQGPTGKIALTWKLDSNNALYAFVATGRKAAGINTTPVTGQLVPPAFAPETVTDFEAGWKPTFFDGHLRAQFGGYYSLYKNFQLSFQLSGAPTASFIQNLAGTTTLYGLEAETQAVFGPLSFDATLSYEHSSMGSASVVDPANPFQIDQLGGKQVPLAPPVTASFGAQYDFDVMGGTLTPRVDYSYTDGQWGTPYQDLGDFLPQRNLVNAELAYKQGPYKVTAFATNAFDLHYVIGANIGLRYAGNPGQYGIRFERRF
jgi:iron complex outermembrane receptor protein